MRLTREEIIALESAAIAVMARENKINENLKSAWQKLADEIRKGKKK